MKNRFLLWLLVFLVPLAALAARPYVAFERTGEALTADFQAWHPEFEENGNYGESWFFIVQADDGGLLYALVSVTNLGLRTFDGSVDVQYHAPDGRSWNVHQEVTRSQIQGSGDRMDLTVGGARVWGGGRAYHLSVDHPEAKVRLDLQNVLPPYMFGNGRIVFHEARDAEYTLGINAPRARASGSVTAGGQTFSLAGHAYHDHGWATIKLPDFISKWYSLRLFDPKYTLVLHRQFLTEDYGGGDIRFGLLGVDDRVVAGSRNFTFTARNTRKHSTGFAVPTVLDVAMNAGGWQVKGTLTETRFVEAIDVLGRISLPVRLAIKAFYTNPYLLRYLVRYDLDVTHDGQTEHISGEAVMEADYY